MSANFDRAFVAVVGVEGGYVNNPNDPGGETKFGISKRAYPDEDIANLTIDRAKFLYQRDYWTPNHCDDLEWGKALLVFDCAVNSGSSHAQKWYSLFAGEPMALFAGDFQAERAHFLAALPTFITFGRGWMRRLFKIYGLSLTP